MNARDSIVDNRTSQVALLVLDCSLVLVQHSTMVAPGLSYVIYEPRNRVATH